MHLDYTGADRWASDQRPFILQVSSHVNTFIMSLVTHLLALRGVNHPLWSDSQQSLNWEDSVLSSVSFSLSTLNLYSLP